MTAEAPQRVDSKTYLGLLRDQTGIKQVYYPGCGHDNESLKGIFDQVVYLDKHPWQIDSLRVKGRVGPNDQIIQADINQVQLPDASFDAVFMQDMHEDQRTFLNILRKLKLGGVFIFSIYPEDCPIPQPIDLSDVRKSPFLEELQLPFSSDFYFAFQRNNMPLTELTASLFARGGQRLK